MASSSPLICCARDGLFSEMERLLKCSFWAESEYINYNEPQEGTALFNAARFNHPDCVKLLLYFGANLDIALDDDDKTTPLEVAMINDHSECVRIIIAKRILEFAKKQKHPAKSAGKTYFNRTNRS